MNAMTTKAAGLVLAAGGLLFAPEGDAPEGARSHGAPRQETVDCLRCHEPIKLEIEAAVPHAPAAEGGCASCHAPHASRFEHMLNLRERALCFSCHEEQSVAFMKGDVHAPILAGQCTVCHEVHGSENPKLLAAAGNELCWTCHEDKHRAAQFATVHEPFVKGNCTDCHAPHNAMNSPLLSKPASVTCAECHDPTTAELKNAHRGIPVEGTRCTSCHDAHASQQKGLLQAVVHQPFGEKSCEECHMVEGPAPRLVRATGGRLCQNCHEGYPRPRDEVVHAPVAEGHCQACHDPHASDHERLLGAPQEALCLECHEDIATRARTSKSAHPTSFEERNQACNGCHQPHSSREEDLLLSGGVRTCLVCHETQRHGHPLGEDRLDPRTGKAITCVTCHDPHGTEFSYHLRGDQSRGLCLQCHDSDSTRADGRR